MAAIIQAEHLVKKFGEVRAVDDISFSVEQGVLFAFLGGNGAGKTTTIRMISGQIPQDSGNIRMNGKILDEKREDLRGRIGVVHQESLLDRELSTLDNLRCRAALYGIKGLEFEKRLDELDQMLSFRGYEKKPLSKLSGGQKRKIDIVRALLHRPSILILDEPTIGLDPEARKGIWKVVKNLQQEESMTVFLTTHYMEEAKDADYIVIMKEGKTVAEGTPHELKTKYARDYLTIYGINREDADRLGIPYRPITGGFRFEIANLSEVVGGIQRNSELFRDFEVVKGSMDDVFLNVVR